MSNEELAYREFVRDRNAQHRRRSRLATLSEEQRSAIADRAFEFFNVPPSEREEGLAAYIIQLTEEALTAGVQEAPAPNHCKLTECQGKPRCDKCVAMGLNVPDGVRVEGGTRALHDLSRLSEEMGEEL